MTESYVRSMSWRSGRRSVMLAAMCVITTGCSSIIRPSGSRALIRDVYRQIATRAVFFVEVMVCTTLVRQPVGCTRQPTATEPTLRPQMRFADSSPAS